MRGIASGKSKVSIDNMMFNYLYLDLVAEVTLASRWWQRRHEWSILKKWHIHTKSFVLMIGCDSRHW